MFRLPSGSVSSLNISNSSSVSNPDIHIEVCVDPKDNKFLSLAVSGNASLILSDDKHLLRLHPFQGISILTPQQYLDAHAIDPNPR